MQSVTVGRAVCSAQAVEAPSHLWKEEVDKSCLFGKLIRKTRACR